MIELAIVLIIAAVCLGFEHLDKRRGRYPRDWR